MFRAKHKPFKMVRVGPLSRPFAKYRLIVKSPYMKNYVDGIGYLMVGCGPI